MLLGLALFPRTCGGFTETKTMIYKILAGLRTIYKVFWKMLFPMRSANELPITRNSTFIQWIALFAGVLIQPFFRTFQNTGIWFWDGFWGWMLFALITSILIFPFVYKNSFDKSKPMIIEVAPIFAAGLGWQSLLTTAMKATVGH